MIGGALCTICFLKWSFMLQGFGKIPLLFLKLAQKEETHLKSIHVNSSIFNLMTLSANERLLLFIMAETVAASV